MKLIPLPAFQDNDLWCMHDGRRALVVDPGDAQPVGAFLQRERLTLEAILVTHHHPDHIDGVDALRDATGAQVFGPATERIPEPLTRLAEGDRISVLGALPGETRVCCTHEYTLSNLRFALAVEPDNLELVHDAKRCEDLRSQDLPTLPSMIGLEKQVDPFLRARVPAVAQAARRHDASTPADEVGVFATPRQWKNEFK